MIAETLRGENLFDHPDYEGSWVEFGSIQRPFSLYILRRTLDLVPFASNETLAENSHGTEIIEGIMTDYVGLSVFSGTFDEKLVEFTKTYNSAARRRGGYPNVVYTGKRDNVGSIVRGNYLVPGTQVIGEFQMRPLRSKLQKAP